MALTLHGRVVEVFQMYGLVSYYFIYLLFVYAEHIDNSLIQQGDDPDSPVYVHDLIAQYLKKTVPHGKQVRIYVAMLRYTHSHLTS